MPTIVGTQICIPIARHRASQVIQQMERLLRERHHRNLTRRQFIRRWASLRKQLFLTEDYQRMRIEVLGRNGGLCEICSHSQSIHVHHLDPVAYAPRRALLVSNVQAVCRGCHSKEHRATTNHARHYQTRAATNRLAHSPTTPNSAPTRGGVGLPPSDTRRGRYHAKEA